ncbi:UNVERIFIED_CONTAM: LINE-1 retrotransposable element O protein [Sesamum latifolium]|uniref:LINE-1 retrotransposable element O protein n=1 Tax=Sesamum latifolium TaxID=2727402 RepID=A0AAW2XDV8_9LAMI
MQHTISAYFQELFRSTSPSEDDIEAVIGGMLPRVSDAMNEILTQPYTAEEVNLAISHMHPYKSPGPDGMSPVFFHKYWHIVGPETTRFVLEFLNHRIFYATYNYTYVVLIPKIPNPETLSHFRPISLCNITYKIASKVLANRLKPLLPTIISESQSAFIPGRLITDNILVAYEINHYLAHKYGGKMGYAALKLDLSKAYDRVEWTFLERVLLRLGFHPDFIYLIIDGVPSREALSHLISQAEVNGDIRGVAVSRHGPRVSHLLFADDTLIFCQASFEAFQCVQRLLENFEKASGLKVNLDKSSVAFSRNTSIEHREGLARVLRVQEVQRHEKVGDVKACPKQASAIIRRLNGIWPLEGRVVRSHGKVFWRLDLIMAGLRWQIGAGRNVRIWTDRWIPRPITFQVITAPNTLSLQALGTVSVDSFRERGSSSCNPSSWNFIWKAEVPPKVRLFTRRVCRDLLPTSANLQRRGALTEGFCPWCGTEHEDLLHTLLRCHFARVVWALTDIPCEYIICSHNNPEEWIRGLHRNLDRTAYCRALITSWLLCGHETGRFLKIFRFQLLRLSTG